MCSVCCIADIIKIVDLPEENFDQADSNTNLSAPDLEMIPLLTKLKQKEFVFIFIKFKCNTCGVS